VIRAAYLSGVIDERPHAGSVMAERSKLHHFVPRLILRGFANGEVIQVADLADNGRSFPQSIYVAAAENDYNTFRLDDGAVSDAAEKAIADIVEGPTGDVIARISQGGWFQNDEEIQAVSRLVVFQRLRVLVRRDEADALADLMMKLDMAAQGPAGMRDALTKGLGRDPTSDEVADYWDSVKDFDEWKLERPREAHVADSLEMLEEFSPMLLAGYSWHVMRWQRRHLLTSDSPRSANFEDSHNVELRRRLKIMAEYAYAHPDEPHPMSPSAPPFDWSAHPDESASS
jgi:hypothetical protein